MVLWHAQELCSLNFSIHKNIKIVNQKWGQSLLSIVGTTVCVGCWLLNELGNVKDVVADVDGPQLEAVAIWKNVKFLKVWVQQHVDQREWLIEAAYKRISLCYFQHFRQYFHISGNISPPNSLFTLIDGENGGGVGGWVVVRVCQPLKTTLSLWKQFLISVLASLGWMIKMTS